MNKITRLIRRAIFRYRLRMVYKRWFPDLDDIAIKAEIDGIMEWHDDDDPISLDRAEYEVSESVSYWSE